jgi:hypothetical protein
MPAHYTIVQFVPDPIVDERVNIGVIVFSDGQIRSRFLQNWDRVSRFAQEDIGYAREFADWVGQAAVRSASDSLMASLPGLPDPIRLDEHSIRRMADEWSNSIQLTAPQPSLEHPDDLLLKAAQTFLREPVRRQQVFRDRQFAARYAASAVRRSVSDRIGPTYAKDIVRSEYSIGGKVVPHLRVDLAITNSHIYLVSQALSFETYNISDLDRQVRDAVYTLRDVGELVSNVQLDLVALPPKAGVKNFRKAADRFHELPTMCNQIGARLVLEGEVPAWAEQIADLVEAQVLPSGLRMAQA